jgi:hypothetical protein
MQLVQSSPNTPDNLTIQLNGSGQLEVINYNYNVPIGSIIAWAKNIPNVPALPAGFVQCDGQVLNDPLSLLHGQTIPNLNGSLGAGLKGYFLRGDSTSGSTESSQNLAHAHTVGYRSGSNGTSSPIGSASNTPDNTTKTSSSDGGSEARPSNYSVVWIMRVI